MAQNPMPRSVTLSRALAPLLAVLSIASQAFGQAQTQSDDIETLLKSAPTVFLDCSSCDTEYIKTEINFVNYVRDRKEAQIHLLVTTQSTGGGGTEFTLTFIGQLAFAGDDHVFRYVSNNTDTQDETRKGLVRVMKIGLLAYAGKTPIANRISISMSGTGKVSTNEVRDRWNYWVFSMSGSGYFSGEQSQRYYSLYGSLSANRVTPGWKIRTTFSANKNMDRFSYEGDTIKSSSSSKNLNTLIVKSVTGHWSIGSWLTASSSTYSNIKLSISPAPAVEYDLFPYEESTRRQLRFLYKAGLYAFRYQEETIFEKTSEHLWGQTGSVTLDLKEKWGEVSATLEGFHYFNDFTKNHIRAYSNLSIRLVKGLRLNFYGSFSRVHDQLSLVKGEATLEEVLLRRRQLATSYNYYGSIGLSYTFGSIYSNVVNPRFGGY
ncbi:MAG: hypothetical protein EHM80_16480 [Nitrospiraceae bacterium]|nr:MAG: hypothetical protein EHM80_16480 [Nitrospiraceae bacterium]